MAERARRPVRTPRAPLLAALLLAMLSLSCRDGATGPAAETATTALTQDESLLRTTWHVVDITDPAGVQHLPYDGRPGPSDAVPTVAYDHTGHLARVMDGQQSYAADRTSNTFEVALQFDLDSRAAFPEAMRPVLFYGVPERSGRQLTLTWSGYAATLTLVAEDRYSPTTSA